MTNLPRLGLYTAKTRKGKAAATNRVIAAARALCDATALANNDLTEEQAHTFVELTNSLFELDELDALERDE